MRPTPYIIYYFSTFGTFITYVLLGVFVYLKNRSSLLHRYCLIFNLSVAFWSVGFFVTLFPGLPHDTALYVSRAHHAVSTFIPPLFCAFVFSLINIYEKRKKLIKFGFLFSTFLFISALTSPHFTKDVISKLYFPYWPVGGPLYFLFVVYFLIFTIYAHWELYKEYRSTSSGRKKRQIIYFFIGTAVGFIGGPTTFFLSFGIGVSPILVCLVTVYPFITAYAIVRYRLLDIEVVIRETAIFAGIFGFAVGAFVVVMYIGQTYLEPYISGHPLFFPAIALFLVTIAVRPIEKLTYNTVGKFLFKKRQKYQKALKDAAEGMATVRKPARLLGLITHILSKNLNPANVAVYIFDEEEKAYFLRAARYPSKIDQRIDFSSEETIITWLKENRQPIVLEEIEHWLREEQLRPHKEVLTSDLEMIKMRLSSLGASICIPSFYHKDELLGLLVLGDKKTGDLYTQDDLELLNSLADEAAFAIRNSILYRKLQKKADEISKIYEKEQTMFAHAATAFANAIDARDPYTHGHSQRVTGYCLALADQMEESRFGGKERYKWFKQRLNIAGLLHDIGKIAIPDSILQKKGKLNAEEWKQMKEHPVVGAKVLGYVRGLWDVVSAVRHHHERYDGGGYPDGLKEESIPFMSRVMAVADTFDAMTSNRPYRKAMTAEVTKQEINNNSTTQFDPYVVGAFMKAYAKSAIKKIMRQNR